jgi:hypothetical protein
VWKVRFAVKSANDWQSNVKYMTGQQQDRTRQWKVRASIFSEWRELPGMHTSAEILRMKLKGDFLLAIPSSSIRRADNEPAS